MELKLYAVTRKQVNEQVVLVLAEDADTARHKANDGNYGITLYSSYGIYHADTWNVQELDYVADYIKTKFKEQMRDEVIAEYLAVQEADGVAAHVPSLSS